MAIYRVSITHRESPKHRPMLAEYLVTTATDPDTAKALALYEHTRDLPEFTAKVMTVHVEADDAAVHYVRTHRAQK